MTGGLVTVAVPKGRLLAESSELFERAVGVSPARLLEGTRRLAAEAPEAGLRFISIRAADVASYVEHGAAAVGVVGLDVLREEPRDLYEPLDLGIGRCNVVVARPRSARPLPLAVAPKVASKYVNLRGKIVRSKILRHSEPILLLGIPESELTKFIRQYEGKFVGDRIEIGKAREGYIVLDASPAPR